MIVYHFSVGEGGGGESNDTPPFCRNSDGYHCMEDVSMYPNIFAELIRRVFSEDLGCHYDSSSPGKGQQ